MGINILSFIYIQICCCLMFLHIAAKSGLVGVVKELINRGADVNIRDADGKFLLMV